MQKDLTHGSVGRVLFRFSLPYLLSCFLQTFYGLADLFITGQFNGADAITAVSVGSQVMHMLTVMIVGLAMGSTVTISRAVGEKDRKKAGRLTAATITLFLRVSAVLTVILLLNADRVVRLIAVPAEAAEQAKWYLMICFAGIPFITAYNIISCIFRGMGDSKSPLYFIGAAGVLNVVLDYIFIGKFGMGAAGAAQATVVSQTISVGIALCAVWKRRSEFPFERDGLKLNRETMGSILRIGIPVACQDGLIQVSFLLITVIANRRGVVAAASVGIVEKMISFVFLVPSAMLSSISAIVAQNVGAGKHQRGVRTLFYGVAVSVLFGTAVTLLAQAAAPQLLGLFTEEEGVIRMGSQYLRSYIFDSIAAGIHFCFSGYFCAYGFSGLSFIQNVVSIILVRVPGAYFASLYYPDTLFPMGLAAPLGSLLSSAICIFFFVWKRKQFLPQKEFDKFPGKGNNRE